MVLSIGSEPVTISYFPPNLQFPHGGLIHNTRDDIKLYCLRDIKNNVLNVKKTLSLKSSSYLIFATYYPANKDYVNGGVIAASAQDSSLHLWPFENIWKKGKPISIPIPLANIEEDQSIINITFTDNKMIIDTNHVLHFYNQSTKFFEHEKTINVWPGEDADDESEITSCIYFPPNKIHKKGGTICGSLEGQVRVRKYQDDDDFQILEGAHTEGVMSIVLMPKIPEICPNGGFATGSWDNTIIIWDFLDFEEGVIEIKLDVGITNMIYIPPTDKFPKGSLAILTFNAGYIYDLVSLTLKKIYTKSKKADEYIRFAHIPVCEEYKYGALAFYDDVGKLTIKPL